MRGGNTLSLFDGYVVNQEINQVVKIYPGLVKLFKYHSPFLVRRYDYDERKYYGKKKSKSHSSDEDSELKSLQRAKTTLIDMTLCNQFDLFTTFTFNGNEINRKKYGYTVTDRADADKCKRKMAYWLNNQRILHGNFKYLIVPEYHKDEKALHFHGLFAGYKGHLKDSGKKQKGRTIFNIRSYRQGHSTAVQIDNLEKVSSYISKYLTKDMPKFKNKQRYWCSNGLKRPLKIVNPLLTEQDKLLFSPVYKDKQKEVFELRGQLPDNDIARIANYGRRRYDDLTVAEW